MKMNNMPHGNITEVHTKYYKKQRKQLILEIAYKY
jgi:hypothetical protein